MITKAKKKADTKASFSPFFGILKDKFEKGAAQILCRRNELGPFG